MCIKRFFNRMYATKEPEPFFVYDHWGPDARCVIHKSDCRFCNEGKGLHDVGQSSYGRWAGPFVSLKEAEEFAQSSGRRVQKCNFCIDS